MTRWALLKVATGLAVAAATGCNSLSDFNGTYEGEIIDGNFVRRCFDTEVTATLEFRAEAAVAVDEFHMPLNSLTTNDGTFDDTPLTPFAAMPHDQLSEMDFPGPSRIRSFMLSARPDSGPLAGRDAMVVVSILEKGSVEVRVMAHTDDAAPPCDPPMPEPAEDEDSDGLVVNPHEYFGVFQLKEK